MEEGRMHCVEAKGWGKGEKLEVLMDDVRFSAGSRVLMKGEAPVEAQQNVIGKMPVEGGELIERRMDFESLDYPGSGANGRHDPRSPGKP
ncbi:hypothetical protein MA16_Dca018156 [Dendrobium catenatum]|uniref:Uncharacterized protein n=1 Tax=Dendrobium catenatum TaxID=906689 RepID=A0A2I0VSR9_9ASPA|nr:hypothetical protein MA16_Dca018156 [Dendrobium catenatum]